MSSLLVVLAAALGASVAGVHAASGERDEMSEQFDRWVAAAIVGGTVILGCW